MAINALEKCEKHQNATGTSKAGRLSKFLTDPDESVKRVKLKKKAKHSPYLHNEKIQLLSRITEKRLYQKKDEHYSSFPLATNIYRASSDEFKALKKKQKTKKSVLTLPNDPAPIPQTCTVSDMNDSEYRKSAKKRLPNTHRKAPVKFRGIEFYDREGHLDVSSTELIAKNYDGDGKRVSKYKHKADKEEFNAQDVWAVLRNINKFQFKLSPHMSDENESLSKKKTTCKRHSNVRKGRRLIETHRTEEIAYVANFEIQSKGSVSQSSSFDRVTVINKDDMNKLETYKPNKNNNIMKLTSNKHKPNVYKCLPRNGPKAIEMKENNRWTLNNKHQNRAMDDFHKVLNNTAARSTETIRESIDSSNYYRSEENDSLTSNPTIKIAHPNEFVEIIQGSLAHNKDTLSKGIADSFHTEQVPKKPSTILLTHETVPMPGKVETNQQPLRKPRLVTTMPSGATMPKLTVGDIKRRLAHLKFPIVVLGKDQLSSSVEVMDYDPPQFDGLDKHIWPFMMEWSNQGRKVHPNIKKREIPIQRFTHNLREVRNDLPVIRPHDVNARKRTDHRRPHGDESSATPRKQKPVHQVKDKMLKLLYIKPSEHDLKNDDEPSKQELKVENSDACTEPGKNQTEAVNDLKELNVAEVMPKKEIILRFGRKPSQGSNSLTGVKHPWSKAKMASDFIDNVMQKIKNGAYYSHDNRMILNNSKSNTKPKVNTGTCFDFKDVSIQTFEDSKTDFEQNYTQSNNLTLTMTDESRITIPGFDDVLPQLEIKTLNINQVAVKHCKTNVMVQFDVAAPSKSRKSSLGNVSVSTKSSCVPLSVTESQTKIFKCNTTILNAVLPAELCSMIPAVIQNLLSSDSKVYTSSSCRDTMSISELSDFESKTVLNLRYDFEAPDFSTFKRPVCPEWVYPPNADWVTPKQCVPVTPPRATPDHPWIASWFPKYNFSLNVIQEVSPKLQNLLSGRFLLTKCKKTQIKRVIKKLAPSLSESVLLRKFQLSAVMPIIVDPLSFIMPKAGKATAISAPLNKCSVVQVYNEVRPLSKVTLLESNWNPPTGEFTHLLQNMWNYCKFNIHLDIPFSTNLLKLANCKTIEITGLDGISKNAVSVTITKFNVGTICNSYLQGKQFGRESIICMRKALPECGEVICQSEEPKITEKRLPVVVAKKTRERGRKRVYVKLYKKCKSTSNISAEKTLTPLSKIGNVEDFVQALGSAKALASVLDGNAGTKIMSYVDEMKAWISDITPRQALLVLLLSNKKETPHLVKFRPIILQGIAVNRITRATELDMEIEVIERENVNMREFEGISYLPASLANKNNLMEELCWIAKTTASDYQKPFDETSEKLLKSLIEKRKKLNPSYLRVMARYVGLGLLKGKN